MIIHPLDVHTDINKARLAVVTVAEALGVECDCSFLSMWVVRIDEKERKTFIELARDNDNANPN